MNRKRPFATLALSAVLARLPSAAKAILALGADDRERLAQLLQRRAK